MQCTMPCTIYSMHHYLLNASLFLLYITFYCTDSKTDAMKSEMKSQPLASDYQRNPAYGHFSHTESSSADLLSGNYSENPAYNIDAQPSAPQEPTYEVIQSDTDKIPQSVICSQNPAYIHLGIQVEESFQAAADATSPDASDYSQNPAYSIHSNPGHRNDI